MLLVTRALMSVELPELLEENNIKVTFTNNRTTLIKKRSKFLSVIIALMGVAFLTVGVVSGNLEVSVTGILVSIATFLTVRTRFKGRTLLLFDRVTSTLIIPANNEYERTTELSFDKISSFELEQAGEDNNSSVNYIFANLTNNKNQLLLTLRNQSNESERLDELLNWLKEELDLNSGD